MDIGGDIRSAAEAIVSKSAVNTLVLGVATESSALDFESDAGRNISRRVFVADNGDDMSPQRLT